VSDQGTLILVVGPSGAGKDTLIGGARTALAGDSRFVFPRRAITRPADAGGEDHEALSEAAFLDRAAAGGFALAWTAHGWRYGVPAGIGRDITAGATVVVSVSRQALADAAARFARVRAILVTAPPDVLAARLQARGRESAFTVASRLARRVEMPPEVPFLAFCNTAPLPDAVRAFTDLLTGDTQANDRVAVR
jgi:phosphonate metabolism protein PhnN/1,5-bisphosphokinase (PRPP-forming)